MIHYKVKELEYLGRRLAKPSEKRRKEKGRKGGQGMILKGRKGLSIGQTKRKGGKEKER